MKVVVLKTLQHDKLGRLNKGRVVDVPANWAKIWLRAGAVERYETKVIREIPLPVTGREEPSSALPVVPASPKTTAKPSRRGKKKAKTGAS